MKQDSYGTKLDFHSMEWNSPCFSFDQVRFQLLTFSLVMASISMNLAPQVQGNSPRIEWWESTSKTYFSTTMTLTSLLQQSVHFINLLLFGAVSSCCGIWKLHESRELRSQQVARFFLDFNTFPSNQNYAPTKLTQMLSCLIYSCTRWWALETLTTVGFGDVTTTSIAGKLLDGRQRWGQREIFWVMQIRT